MANRPVVTIVDEINSTTSNTIHALDMVSSSGLLVVDDSQLTDQMRRELISLLFEFYITNEDEDDILIKNKNLIWTHNQRTSLTIIAMPMDCKIKIIPKFDEDYINRLPIGTSATSSFPISIYFDPNVSLGNIGEDGYLILE